MKNLWLGVIVFLSLLTPLVGPAAEEGSFALPPKVRAFAGDKWRQVQVAATKFKATVLPMANDYFEAAVRGEAAQAMDMYREVSEFLRSESKDEVQNQLDGITGQAAMEVQLALESFTEGEPRLALAWGEAVVKSIPAGSIYFSGTDPGRGLPTALCASHERGEPFFTLTQAAMVGGRYRAYVEWMYGDKIVVPSKKDVDAAFSSYIKDAERRAKHDRDFPKDPKQLLPGEQVTFRDGKVQVGGRVAVTQINGILVKKVFSENGAREFFVEEGSPVSWMYPHLTPHGLIMKLNRRPVESISGEVVEKDRKFWRGLQVGLIGDWLKPETSVRELAEFVERVFGRRELEGFKGDRAFVQNQNSGKLYAKPRAAIAGVYEWRAINATSNAERDRMAGEADFAFRQAVAMCPSASESVMRYVAFLKAQGRRADARLISRAAAEADPGNQVLEELILEFESDSK